MALYRYKALNARGEELSGQMEAASDTEVAARLQEQGHLPMEAKLASEAGSDFNWRGLFQTKPYSGARLVQFTQQLATLLGAGQPLDRALSILLEQPEDEASKRVLTDVRDAVRGGATLSSSLERHHDIFGRLYVNMVRAGEAGGSLQDTLQRLAEYLERARALRVKVVNALVYPIILLAMVGLSLLFLLGYVVPQFSAMYDSLGADLPWFSRLVLWTGNFVRNWWIVVLVLPLLAVLWLDRKRRDQAFMRRVDEWALQNKFAGPLVAKLDTARLARTLGTLLRNGVPMLAALGIARNVLDNRVLATDVEAAADAVRNGGGLSVALGKSKRFPRLALQMIQVGEESGVLDAMLIKVADTFEADTQTTMDRLLAALVPAITLVLAVVVGVVILSVLAPIYDLTNVVG